MRSPIALATAALLLVTACAAGPMPSPPAGRTEAPVAAGTIVVSYEPRDAPSQVFNGSARVRVVADDGAIAADAPLTDGVRLEVPAGTYAVEVVFVYVADWMSCMPDPVVAGQQTCFLPSLTPIPGCAATEVAVAPDAEVVLRHRIVADGSCRLAPDRA
jgi:hypothetical protein